MTLPCETCGGQCCQYFCFEIDAPDDYEEFEDIRWYLCHEGVSIHIDEGEDWYIQIANRCLKLDADSRCSIYDDRPLICRNYGENCEATGSDYGYLEEFTTPEELDTYARRTLGAKTYDKEMVRHRAKAEGVGKSEMKRQLIRMGRLAPKGKKGKAG